MKISIFGTGYVGLVTGTCFAELGNHVVCVDIDAEKIAQLQAGICPIHEPGLPELIQKNLQTGHLRFSTDPVDAIQHGMCIFIAVGTPSAQDGSADLRYVFEVAKTIGQHLADYRVVINKSTVPVGTADAVKQIIQQELDQRDSSVAFDVASNPEFLREGVAINDFLASDRIILGFDSVQAKDHLLNLYRYFNRNGDRVICMQPRAAELTKYAANAMLATKISFMNEMSLLAEKIGADIDDVRLGIGADPRIGRQFINPGCGYGGSCFPKDVQALEHMATNVKLDLMLVRSVHQVNERQKTVLFDKIHRHFDGQLQGKVIALWGLAFKPDTDDMREAPSQILMKQLFQAGATVQAHDPVAMKEAKRLHGDHPQLSLHPTPEAAIVGADALVIVTEWPQFISPDFHYLYTTLKQTVIFDGRNLYDPAYLVKLGFTYYGIGRGQSLQSPTIV